MIAITICSTKSYCYALPELALRLQPVFDREPKGVIILIGDHSLEFKAAAEFFDTIRPVNKSWHLDVISLDLAETENYQPDAQKTIARMRSAAFSLARKYSADLCWSLDSDVLPAANAYRCLKGMLEFDDGFYGVSTCPYPSQGGALFLGGRGTPSQPILPDFYVEEREVPPELLERLATPILDAEDNKSRREALDKCPPRGNVFAMNAIGWKRRGWLDHAYPGIGIGAVVPVDWCGFGCTLLSRKALDLAEFSGYTGEGTEDLYIVWKKWTPAGVRINSITHCPADHVIRDREAPGTYWLMQTGHEQTPGEYIGHLRVERRPFHSILPTA